MYQDRKRFATPINSEILSIVRTLADKEGRQLQALVDEASADSDRALRGGVPIY